MKGSWVKGFAGAVLAMSMLFFARPAAAADATAESEALIKQGLEWRGRGKPSRALPVLEKAYELAPSPRTAAHLGLVDMELGRYSEAEKYLGEALASPEHPWIAKNKADLKRQLEDAKRHIGELAVTVKPDGAEILVNGRAAGQAPLGAPLRVDKGKVEVQVRATGYIPATETVTIAAGKREQRSFTLELDPTVPRPQVATTPPPATPATTLAANTAPAAEPTAVATAQATPATSSGDYRGALRLSAWISGGLAVGALAFGTYEAFQMVSARDAFNNHMGTVNGVFGKDCGTGALSADCKPLKDDYDNAVTLSIVGFAAAGALAAAATTLFVLSMPERGPTAQAAGSAHALACVPNLVGRGLTCSLRF